MDRRQILAMRREEDAAYDEWCQVAEAYDKVDEHRRRAVYRAERSVRIRMRPYTPLQFVRIEKKIVAGDVRTFWGRRATDIAQVRRLIPEVTAARDRREAVVEREGAAALAAWNRRAAAAVRIVKASAYAETLTGVPRAKLLAMRRVRTVPPPLKAVPRDE